MDDTLLLAASNRTENLGGFVKDGYEGKFHHWVLSDEEIHEIKFGDLLIIEAQGGNV